MSDVLICVHCKNPVEEIQYREEGFQMGGTLANKYKHARPRPYPICGKNPIMDEDVEWVDEEAT